LKFLNLRGSWITDFFNIKFWIFWLATLLKVKQAYTATTRGSGLRVRFLTKWNDLIPNYVSLLTKGARGPVWKVNQGISTNTKCAWILTQNCCPARFICYLCINLL
jgi:hypothetical protein